MDETIAVTALDRWMTLPDSPIDPGIAGRGRVDVIQKALDDLDDLGGFGPVEVVSASVNTTGAFEAPPIDWDLPPGLVLPETVTVTDLPDFCDVRVRHTSPGGHQVETVVWVPLRWNRRFLGTAGGGNRTSVGWIPWPPFGRMVSMPVALRNGFAAAVTDAGIRDRRLVDWAFTNGSGDLDVELIRNWSYRSTHDMTVIGKAVTEAIHGAPPRYSYFQGLSGGGRQALMQAQRYPEDYDGLWAANPGINWTRFIPAELWPPLVMQEEANPLSPAKLDAFQAAAVAACDGGDGLRDGIIGHFDKQTFDPASAIGQPTADGEITATDAEVMAKIWAGPTRRNGESLWYGLRPGAESWGRNLNSSGLCMTAEVDGKLRPVPFVIAESWMRWVAGDPDLTIADLDYDRYEELYDRGVAEFAEFATDDPDLSGLRDRSGKVIISHGIDDEVIFVEGSIQYYERVVEAMGGLEATTPFARLFVTEGDGHSDCARPGPGLSVAAGMAALMTWVESGVAPDGIIAVAVDPMTGGTRATRPTYPYPMAPRYRGSGDPNDAASFMADRP